MQMHIHPVAQTVMKTATHPVSARANCFTQLSSSMTSLAKLLRTSRNVGREPVVSPFNRCAVTVGASAMKGYRAAEPSREPADTR